MSNQNLSTNFAGIKFKNPVLLASGTAGYGNEISEYLDLNIIGGVVTKSLSMKPRKGNPPPRIVETAAGMLNAIGLANVGVSEFIKTTLPFFEKYDTNLICNIAASTIEEYAECVGELTQSNVIKAFEINVSCPNVKSGGLIFGNDVDSVAKITSAVKKVSTKPIIIKLSPNVSNISQFASAVKENGGDAVSAINTLVGMAININTRKPALSNITGGLSGPAIKPIAIAKVFEISQHVDIPIIGIGGVSKWEDVIEFMLAGSTLIQLGTINFVEPGAALKVIDGLNKYCQLNKLESLSSIIGAINLPTSGKK